MLADKATTLNGWLPDGSGVLVHYGSPSRIFVIDIATGKQTGLLSYPAASVKWASLSADGVWITFSRQLRAGHRSLTAAPYRNGKAGDPTEWVEITDGAYDDDQPRFSPDGARLYFQSNRDGFVCVWTQRLNPGTKRPVGLPEAIEHYHAATRSLDMLYGDRFPVELHISMAADKMLVNLDEVRSDLWMTEVGR
jgi:hypothetical protein